MASNKKKNVNLQDEKVEVVDPDFSFVQKDVAHDVDLSTKPTTFFKDAMKRFLKNRSSVVAAGILLVLITMAIVVPLANKNNVETPTSGIKYLPPKWFDTNAAGFMDGTANVKAVLDPSTRQLPQDSAYKQGGVIGEISIEESFSDSLDNSTIQYGHGGSMSVRATKEDQDAGVQSQPLSYKVGEDVAFTVGLDSKSMSETNNDAISYYLAFVTTFDNINDVIIPLSEVETNIPSNDYVLDAISTDNVATRVASDPEYIAAGSPEYLNASFAFVVKGAITLEGTLNKAYITSVSYTVPEGSESDLAKSAWDNATRAVQILKDKSKDTDGVRYESFRSAEAGIHKSIVLYGNFKYDYYAGAFGDDTFVFDSGTVQEFIDKGWMEFTWAPGNGVKPVEEGQFKLTELGEKYCPIREAITQKVNATSFGITTRELTCTRSLYRYYYYKGIIGECAVPKYFFGTDSNGYDFFKLAFSGLLLSLGLGVLASVINIVIGLVWGAISGYFGGWVDLLMERFTEILGGMPWIVMMTLIVLLLGSNFWTFLLALCLTGWMGVAGRTRSQFYRFKRREYVLASRTLGAGDARLIFKHILPNGIGTIITSSVLMIPGVIFTEANISYLLPNALSLDQTSFGLTLANVQSDLQLYPYLIVSASIIMMLIMISFNLFGNGLRDAFNPSLKGSGD